MIQNFLQKEPVILVPVYRPDGQLVQLVHQLRQMSQQAIVIVDDGNQDITSTDLLEDLAAIDAVQVISHFTNQGKGAAIKTGFKYIFEHFPNTVGCVTADADGQHTSQDILAIGQQLVANQGERLVMGMRDFTSPNSTIPLRSRVGNRLTSWLFRIATGISCEDTQTGLRGIPLDEMQCLLKVEGQRFDYEMNQLLETTQRLGQFDSVPIQTIYIDENASSHFNPIQDSIRVIKPLVKFMVSSMTSTLVDLSFFRFFTTSRH